MRARLLLLAGAAPLVVAGCGEGVLDARGEGASRIVELWWVMFALTMIPLAIVSALLVLVLVRRRDAPAPAEERGDRRWIVLGGVVLPLVVLLPILALTITTGRALGYGDEEDALEVEIVAHQFWWDIRYPLPGSSSLDGGSFRTANELHIPVGRPVTVRLESNDVIHSFWVPQLHGKMDLVPGRTNTLTLLAEEPGVYKGRCAELCGLGHGVMRFLVIAEPEEEFEAWLADEAGPLAVEPDPVVRQEFANSCAPCHDVRGLFEQEQEAFSGTFGPDLTHFASRRTIGADLLPNTREALGRWIVDPQGVKPGNRMPDVGLDGEELTTIVDFLRELE